MKNKVTSTVSAICSALFIIAIIYLAAGIYIENQKGPEKAQARFDTLMLSTRTAAAKYNIGTPDFSSQFIKAIDDISDFSILRLKINDQLVYNYPPQSFFFLSLYRRLVFLCFWWSHRSPFFVQAVRDFCIFCHIR